VDIEVNQSVLY
jgi:hypothetical protein